MSSPKKVISLNAGRADGGSPGLHPGKGLPEPFLRGALYNPAWTSLSNAFTYGGPLYLPLPNLGDVTWNQFIMGGNEFDFGYSIGNGGDPKYTVLSHTQTLLGGAPYVSSVSQAGTTLKLEAGPTRIDSMSDYLGSAPFGRSASFPGGKTVFIYFSSDEHQKMVSFNGTMVGNIIDLTTLFGGRLSFSNMTFRHTSYGVLNLVNSGIVTDSRAILYRVNDDLTIDFLDNISAVNDSYVWWSYGHVTLSDTQVVVQGLLGSNAAFFTLTRSGDTISIGTPHTLTPTFGLQYAARLDDNHFIGVLNGTSYGLAVSGTTITEVGAPFGLSDDSFMFRFSPDPTKMIASAQANIGFDPTALKIYGISGNITQDFGDDRSPVIDNYITAFDCNKIDTDEMIFQGFYTGIDSIYPHTAKDSSGNGNDATYDNFGLWGVQGLVSGGYCWGGSLLGPLPDGTLQDAFSIEFWRREGGSLSSGGAIEMLGTFIFELFLDFDNRRLHLVRFGDTIDDFYSLPDTFPIDYNPHHYVITYTPPSVDAQAVHFYVDGVEVGTEAGSYVDSATNQPTNLFLYTFSSSVAHDTGGINLLDEFALYNAAMTAEQVAQHYAAKNSGGVYSSAVMGLSPVVYLQFNELFTGTSGSHVSATGSVKSQKMRQSKAKVIINNR